MPVASRRRGWAFAPAHVTGFFAPSLEARDPRARGSVGAGLVLEAGVTAEARWEPGPSAGFRLTSRPSGRLEISREVARRLLGRRPGRLSVHLEHAVPIGQGFGASAAGALATGLAVASVLGVPRAKTVEVAHLADLFGRGGLGGVAAILAGGLELRLRPGIPPYGRIVHRPVSARVIVGTVGPPIPSPGLLGGRGGADRFALGRRLLDAVARSPDLGSFWAASEEFTDAVGLASPRLRAVVRGLRRRGARAAQAMFGQSFVAAAPSPEATRAITRWLSAGAIDFRELQVGSKGAHALPAPVP